MNNTKVSVIVPVYNVEEYIHRCIDSILSQTFTDFECILVDDCSPDNCGKICDEYSNKDSRVKVIHKPQNEGLPQARKTGFEHSTGDYIQFVDSDDWIKNDMIEILYNYAINGNYDILIFDYFYVKNDIILLTEQKINVFDKIKIIKEVFYDIIKAYVWNKFVKRELLNNIEFPINNYCEDMVISVQNIYYAKNIGYLNSAFYYYFFNDKSILQNKERKVTGRMEENRNYNKILIFLKKKYGDLNIFEPELSYRINKIKQKCFIDKELRKIKELFTLYPESDFIKFMFICFLKSFIKIFLPINFYNKMKNLYLFKNKDEYEYNYEKS